MCYLGVTGVMAVMAYSSQSLTRPLTALCEANRHELHDNRIVLLQLPHRATLLVLVLAGRGGRTFAPGAGRGGMGSRPLPSGGFTVAVIKPPLS
jgi:hypothetical protein